MARIAGVDIPKTKQIWVSLQYLYGIGRSQSLEILDKTDIDPVTRTENLTEDEVNRIRDIISKEYKIEGDVRKLVSMNIKRLIEIGSYRGMRHRAQFAGSRAADTNQFQDQKRPRKTVAGRGQKRGMTKT